MAVCLECKADYIRGITVCPACDRPLVPDAAPPVEELSDDFVELMGAPYASGVTAAASLEAAGLETRMTTIAPNVYMPAAVNVIILVRERDLDAARSVLKIAPPHGSKPIHPTCAACGAPATVHETDREGGAIRTTHYCAGHAPFRLPSTCEAGIVDEDVRRAVEALDVHEGVRTVCSCSGAHPGAGEGFISLGPAEGDDAVPLFDAFVERLKTRVETSELADRLAVDWSAVHGAEITLIRASQARETWTDLARLLSTL